MTIEDINKKINIFEEQKMEYYETIKVSNDPDIVAKATEKAEKIENNIDQWKEKKENLHLKQNTKNAGTSK